MSLHRVVYYSRNRIADPAALPAAIAQILAVSQRNNRASGVTGALMFNAGCFAQVLEGERAPLEATLERIQQDERHGDVSLLAFEAVERRAFAQWSMGFVGGAPDGAGYAGIASASGFDLSAISGDRMFRLLHDLALEEEVSMA